ncbi:MAG: putative glycoside hydrolase [Candidatus Sulfotelmatobacter sp.]
MRRSSVLTIAAVSCLLCGASAVRLNLHRSFALAAQEQSSEQSSSAQAAGQAAGLSRPQAAATVQPAAMLVAAAPQSGELMPASATMPGTIKPADLTSSSPRVPSTATEFYTTKRGDTLPAIAHHYLGQTAYLTSSELADGIRAANKNLGSSNILGAGQQITIPGILPAPIVAHTIPVPKDFEVRAIYLTGIMAASDHGLRIIRQWRAVGGNAVVFDIKDSDGSVNIPYEHPLLGKHQVYIHDLPKFIQFLHSENMHAIARIAIFRDQRLVTEHPELAVHSKKTGQPWRENGKLVWTDSSNPPVQDYNIALAKFVAQSGADEIQFDYVRFPAEGDQKDAGFLFQKEHPDNPKNSRGDSRPRLSAERSSGAQLQRSDVITAFLKKAYAQLHPTGVLLSLDVFGVMAWQRQVDLSHTGQDIVGMAKYCDVISPMIYPSHFFGMDNIQNPGDAPEHFIGESMERFELITRGSGVVIRPWLQAFHWRTKTYSPEYIKIQVATAREKGGIGFLFWNAANDYSKPYTAMPEMKAENPKAAPTGQPKYFRGDELPGATVKASVISTVLPVPADR